MTKTSKCAAAVARGGMPTALLALIAPLALAAAHAAAPPWKPDKAVELIATNAPGGGSDRILRIMAKVLQEGRHMQAQIAYWEEAIRRMVDSEEWKKELETNFWLSDYMGSVETRKFMERDNAQARAFLVDLGLAK